MPGATGGPPPGGGGGAPSPPGGGGGAPPPGGGGGGAAYAESDAAPNTRPTRSGSDLSRLSFFIAIACALDPCKGDGTLPAARRRSQATPTVQASLVLVLNVGAVVRRTWFSQSRGSAGGAWLDPEPTQLEPGGASFANSRPSPFWPGTLEALGTGGKQRQLCRADLGALEFLGRDACVVRSRQPDRRRGDLFSGTCAHPA